jgi:hypothetical protein
MKGVKQIALRDIRASLGDTIKVNHNRHREVWVVSTNVLDSKQTAILNRQLGLHKINKTKPKTL